MKRKILATLFAMTALAFAQSSDARNPNKGGGGDGSPPPINSPRNFGNYDAECNTIGSEATSRYQNVQGLGPSVHLVVKNNGVASTSVKGLNNTTVTMLGAIQFTIRGATGTHLGVNITITTPGANTSVTKFFSVSNGRIKSAGNNVYYIAVQDILNTVIIPPGSRLDNVVFLLQGLGDSTRLTSDVSNLSFTGFGPVGYDLTDPSASCGIE